MTGLYPLETRTHDTLKKAPRSHSFHGQEHLSDMFVPLFLKRFFSYNDTSPTGRAGVGVSSWPDNVYPSDEQHMTHMIEIYNQLPIS